MKRSVRCLLAAAPLLVSALADAKDLPNYNAYYAAKPAASALPPGRSSPPALVASTDDRRGVPTFLWAARSTSASSAAVAGFTPEAAARRHLQQHAARYGLSSAALATAFVSQIHDTGRGGIIVVLRQRPGGVEVFHGDVKVLMDRNLDLVAIGGNLHADAVPTPKSAGFRLREPQAIAAAIKDLYGLPAQPADFVDLKKTKGGYDYFELGQGSAMKGKGLHLVEPARVKRVWFPLPDRLVPAYFVEFFSGKGTDATSDAYSYVIAADDGRLLYRENLTHSDTFNYRTFADASGDHRPMDGPIADYTPYPASLPNGSVPAYATPNLISIDGLNKFHDPWLPSGATVSTGNNVDAYTDDDAPDGFSGGSDIRATTTSAGTFDRVFDTSLGPQSSDNQRMAAITDLFYTTNWLHDWWYDSGFDEAAGNAQQDNYGRGGIAGDPLHAEAQDGAPQQRNNSNMSVASDGMSPRMQMFVWDGVGGATTLNVQPLNQSLPTGSADFGVQGFSVSGTLALVDDGSAPVTDACTPIVNNVSGKIAVIDRGACSFQQKAAYAEAAGAIAVILIDNQSNATPPHLYPDPMAPNVGIPSLSVTLADGNSIKTTLLGGPVTSTMTRIASVDRDGTIDNTVVAHEWGHYIHLRQVACGSQACGAESEGWGDFHALNMVVRQGDNLDGAFGLAQYATASFPDDPAYFGIRRYPYSVDFTKNPLTFKYIADSETLPTSASIAQGNAGAPNSEVHAAGEIWASMLFEGFIALLKQSQGPNPPYTFDQARRRMTDYAEGGYKMAPVDPTYTEQRDAILAAAAAADLNDLAILAQAFARRGAGTCAVSPPRDSTDFSGVIESFTVQPNLAILSVKIDDSVKSCDNDGHLDAEETGKITVQVVNAGTAPFPNASVTVASTTVGVTFPTGATVSFGALAPYAKATASVEIALAPTIVKMENLDLTVTVDGTASCGASASVTTAPLVNFDEIKKSSAVDTVEADDSVWTPTGDNADQIWSRTEPKAGNHVWAGIDFPSPSDTSLVSPSLDVGATDKFLLTFDHRHQFETSMSIFWDGSVIEISTDGGANWQDISMFGDPGYGGNIGDPMNQAKNVLRNHQGYVDTNPSWPAMDTVTIDMGTKLAGKAVLVRFRIGTDDAAGTTGWELDNIKFDGITNKPFASLVDDTSSCGAAPIADAGPDQTVAGGALVTLDGSKSFDPGSLPLTYAWTETAGSPVTLTGGTAAKLTFTAPAVTAPTTMTFQLTVKDGKASGSDSVNVVVNPGSGMADAGPDGGSMPVASDGGCNCRAANSGSGTGAGLSASLLALAALCIRRRRRIWSC